MPSGRFTKEQMDSRRRIVRLHAVINESLETIYKTEPDLTYEEVVFALTEAAHRWAGFCWKSDFETKN